MHASLCDKLIPSVAHHSSNFFIGSSISITPIFRPIGLNFELATIPFIEDKFKLLLVMRLAGGQCLHLFR